MKTDRSTILNKAQKEAVEAVFGPHLVIAGAGTGKTRVLEYRALELIRQGIEPSAILLLTFTRRAASEMLLRTGRHDPRSKNVAGGTFHSFALSILKRESKLLGLDSFTIIDRTDSQDVIGKIIQEMKLREKKYFPKKNTVNDIISKSLNKKLTISEILAKDYPQFSEWEKVIELVKMRFAKYKLGKGLVDYDDLLLYLIKLLEKFPHVRQKINQKYRFIMVDEYQDTNKLQAKIVVLLGKDHQNVLIVGDEMQSIYAFRGANFENMINFPSSFPKTKTITLEENYRSTQEILDVANSVMEEVIGPHYKKYLQSVKHGAKPIYFQFKSAKEEASYVAREILKLVNKGIALHQIAVLFRAAYQSAPLEIELTSLGIPFKKFGGIRFIETAHVKDILAHIRVLANAKDEISWRRILLLIEGVGEKTADMLVAKIMALQNYQKVLNNDLTGGLFELLKLIDTEKLTPSEKIKQIFLYYQPLLRKIHDDYPQRQQDLSALIDITASYTKIDEMLDDFALEPPDASTVAFLGKREGEDWVCLSTIHSAKGLEWNTVFVIGVQEGKFPIIRANTEESDIEEERRLFYVAVTRPKERLFITSAQGQRGSYFESWYFNKPSRFIEPLLNQNLLEVYGVKPFSQFGSSLDSTDSFDEGIDKF